MNFIITSCAHKPFTAFTPLNSISGITRITFLYLQYYFTPRLCLTVSMKQ